jgi:hypothetical protein
MTQQQAGNTISLEGGQKQPGSALAAIESNRAIQEVQAALIIAKKFPRDENEAALRILNSCKRVQLAEAGIYEYARGGNEISGVSIRLAEVMARSWGNLSFGWREIERKTGASVLHTYCWDQETNVKRELIFDVRHWRGTKSGGYALTDDRDIYENNANQAARRLRQCILALIPGDIQEAAVEECERTIATQVTPEKIADMVNAFARYGVNKKMIEAKIQKNLDAISGHQVIELRRIYNSLKDGMSGVSQWFDLNLSDKPEAAEVSEPKAGLDKFKENQAAKQAEPATSGETACESCHGTGIIEDREGKGPCPHCAAKKAGGK